MTPEPRRIPDALLERYLADALSAEAKARLETTLNTSPRDQARLAELRADSAAFLLQHPPGPLVARFEAASRKQKWWQRPRLLAPLFAATAAAAIVLALLPPPEDPYTAKGPVILVLHRKEGARSVTVPMNGPVAPHDSLRFEVKGATGGFVAVLSRDSQGVLTVYYPFRRLGCGAL
jgi:anti-sigma factor RsiW